MITLEKLVVRIFTLMDCIDIPCDSLCEVEEILDNAEHEGFRARIISLPTFRRLTVEES